MRGNKDKLCDKVREALEAKSDELSISYSGSDTTADLCTKINNA